MATGHLPHSCPIVILLPDVPTGDVLSMEVGDQIRPTEHTTYNGLLKENFTEGHSNNVQCLGTYWNGFGGMEISSMDSVHSKPPIPIHSGLYIGTLWTILCPYYSPCHVGTDPSPQGLVQLEGLGLIGTLCVAIVMESPDGQVVHVDPDGPPPVGRVMFSVILRRNGERDHHYLPYCTSYVPQSECVMECEGVWSSHLLVEWIVLCQRPQSIVSPQ